MSICNDLLSEVCLSINIGHTNVDGKTYGVHTWSVDTLGDLLLQKKCSFRAKECERESILEGPIIFFHAVFMGLEHLYQKFKYTCTVYPGKAANYF